MNTQEFIKHLTKLRLAGGWYQFVGTVNGKHVELKAYQTWNQILRVNGLRDGGLYDLNVTGWKKELVDAVERLPTITL